MATNTDPNSAVYSQAYKTGRGYLTKAAAQYASGGDYTKGIEAALARLSKKSVASGMSNLVSSGLAGTTMAGGLANKFAEETAAPALAQAESERAKGLADVYMQSANFAGQYGDAPTTTTTIAPSRLTSSAFAPTRAVATAPVSNRSSQGMLDKYGNPATYGQTKTTSRVSQNPKYRQQDSSQEPNWVVLNGKRYTQNPSTGQWNF